MVWRNSRSPLRQKGPDWPRMRLETLNPPQEDRRTPQLWSARGRSSKRNSANQLPTIRHLTAPKINRASTEMCSILELLRKLELRLRHSSTGDLPVVPVNRDAQMTILAEDDVRSADSSPSEDVDSFRTSFSRIHESVPCRECVE
jgi:hypothetical protein